MPQGWQADPWAAPYGGHLTDLGPGPGVRGPIAFDHSDAVLISGCVLAAHQPVLDLARSEDFDGEEGRSEHRCLHHPCGHAT